MRSVSDALNLVRLTPLMRETSGRPEIAIGLIDGPVFTDHSDFDRQRMRVLRSDDQRRRCHRSNGLACQHGTFVAGILSARRGAAAPAISPGCTLLVRPIFSDQLPSGEAVPSAEPRELAAAIVECVEAGARLINVSAALSQLPSADGARALQGALDHATHRGVIVVAAAGNQARVGSTALTRHPGVIPVAGCDRRGRPLGESNLARSAAQRGRSAPAEGVVSLTADGPSVPSGGTSVAAPFVTGTLALVWSAFPKATAARVRLAIHRAGVPPRSVVPPLLDAWAIYRAMGGAAEGATK